MHGLCTGPDLTVNCVTGEVAAETKREAISSITVANRIFRSGNSFTHPISVSRGERLSMVTVPWSGKIIPAQSLRNVVFPLPFGPIMVVMPGFNGQ